MDVINLFHLTMQEYQKITGIKEMVLNQEYESERMYTALQLRLMLMRKYITKKEQVYILKVISEIEYIIGKENTDISKILDEFNSIIKKQNIHRLSDGTELNIFESLNNLMYGLHLHSDSSRIDNLNLTNEALTTHLTYNFIKNFEPLLFKLNDLIIEENLILEKVYNIEKSPVLILEKAFETKNVIKSEFWTNIQGKDIKDVDLHKYSKFLNKVESKMIEDLELFFELLKDTKLNANHLRKMVVFSTLGDWTNFEIVAGYVSGIKNLGFSNKIRYSKNMKRAYIYLLPNINVAFEITTEQYIPNVYIVEFRKSFLNDNFKIYSIGETAPKEYIYRDLDS